MGVPGTPLQTGLLAMRHFLGQQKGQKITITPVFFSARSATCW
jgi:hypothetical protein